MSEILIGANATPLPETAEKKAKQIPEPSGFRILCMVPEVEDKFDSGLIKADTTVYAEGKANYCPICHEAWAGLLQGYVSV
jgi:hypothetical protein